MQCKKESKTQLLLAITFALAMLVVSYLASDHDNASAMLLGLICVYTALMQRPALSRRNCKN